MATTFFISAGEHVPFFATPETICLEPIYETRPAIESKPRVKMPRSVNRNYSDSELATAQKMMDRLRNRRDVVEAVFAEPIPNPRDHDRALDVVVEKLIDRLAEWREE